MRVSQVVKTNARELRPAHRQRPARLSIEERLQALAEAGELTRPSVPKGRWTWNQRPAKAQETICPACHRINDKYPKGMLTLNGPYFIANRTEILNLARNEEAKEKKEHPLARIMAIEEHPEGTVITTTDTHLPRRIGEALHHAYDGNFSFHYDEGEQFVRAKWTR